MAGLNMGRAFNAKFLVNLTRYNQLDGSYNDTNDFIEGELVESRIRAVVRTTKYKGETVINEDGGVRTSNYKRISIKTPEYDLELGDIVEYRSKYFTVHKQVDHDEYGFKSYLIEESNKWTPPTTTQA